MTNIMRARHCQRICLMLFFLLGGLLAGPQAFAQFIDRVEVNRTDGEAEIRVVFTVRIQYNRHTPLEQGEQLQVFLTNIELDQLGMAGNQGRTIEDTRKSPPSSLVPGFTISYPDHVGSMVIRFSRPVSWRVRPGPDGRSISILVPLAKEAVAPAKKPAKAAAAATRDKKPVPASPAVAAEVEGQAQQLMAQAREALQKNETANAVEILNKLLNLPPNKYSQEAQALIGDARLKNSEPDRARAEYELYLELYPDAPDAKRVKDALAKLGPEKKTGELAAVERAPEQPTRQVYGSVSQYYYHGKSQTETRPNQPGLNLNPETLTATDESALVSTVDLTGRFKNESHDNRLVVRDSYRWSFLQGQASQNRLNAAYFENLQKDMGYLLRLGRQPGSSAGLLGTFDGAWFGKDVGSKWRVNGVVGQPVDFFSNFNKLQYGASVELLPLADKFSGDVYVIEQRVDRTVERRALGTELRYFDAKSNYFGLLDYDTIYKSLNVAMLQGNWFAPTGTNVFFLADYRRAPALQLTNALPSDPNLISVRDLINSVGLDEARSRAKALTPISTLYQLGFTQPITPRWQLGSDVRLSHVAGTDAAGAQVAQPSQGNIWVYSAQAIGNGIFAGNDVAVLNGSYINAPSATPGYHAYSLSANHALSFMDRWRLDTALRYYAQKSDDQTRNSRINPSAKLGYRWKDNVTLEGEAGLEYSTVNGLSSTDTTRRDYFYVGYRWDFF